MSDGWQAQVTPREGEVLDLVRRHRTNEQMAEELHLSRRTVESHVASLLRKSGARDRRDLARAAEERDIDAAIRVSGVRTYDTSLVGRSDLLAELTATLERSRVVSLVGPGGVGKTRLLHELLAQASPGWARVAVVDLLPVTGGRVTDAVAAALGVIDRASTPVRERVLATIGTQPVLLGLDNAEHILVETADLASRVAAACPRAVVAVTSREPLRLPGEHVVPVPAFTGGREDDAVALFCDRAGVSVDMGAMPLVSLVRQLDGLPLCLELAAARVPSLGLHGLSAAMAQPLSVLAGGRDHDERHRSAHAVVAWSYSLLTEEERRLLRDLGGVHHDVDLASAAALVGLSDAHTARLLAQLAEKSLLTLRPGGPDRWAMSQVVREFVRDMARRDPSAERAQRDVRRFEWARDRAAETVQRPGAVPAGTELADLVTLATADPVTDAAGAAASVPSVGELPRAVATLCTRAGRLRDAVDCLTAAAAQAGSTPHAVEDLLEAASLSAARATASDAANRLPVRAAELADACGDVDLQVRALAVAVTHRHRYPTPTAVAASLPDPASLLDRARALDHHRAETAAALAVAEAWHLRDSDRAEKAVAVSERTGDPAVVAGALDVLADAYAGSCRYRAARRAAVRRLSLLRTVPEEGPRVVEEIVDARHMAARTALVVGELDAAADAGISGEAPHPDELSTLPWLVRCRALQGRFEEAIEGADRLWSLWERMGSRPAVWMATTGAAAVLALGVRDDLREGRWRQRMLRLADADAGDDLPLLAAFIAYVDARLAVHRSDLADAERLVERCAAGFTDRWYEGFARGAGAELALAAGLPADALLDDLRSHAQQSDWAAAVHLRCLAQLEPAAGHRAAAVALWERIGAQFEKAVTLAPPSSRPE